MAVTHAEFFRLLGKVVGERRVARRETGARVETDVGVINISLGEEATRRLGLLEVPVTRVTLEFQGYSAEEYEVFMRRFNLGFQKGGG